MDIWVLMKGQILRNKKKIIGGVVFLTFVFLFLIVLNLLVVRNIVPTTYSSEIQVTLPSQNGVLTYYSGAPFSSCDIIVPQVLMTVYNTLDLKRFISEKDFLAQVAIEEITPELLKAEAVYRSALGVRHPTQAQIEAASKAYHAALGKLSARRYRIFFTAGVPESVAAKILTMIPNLWASFEKSAMLPRPPQFSFAETNKDLCLFEKADLIDREYQRLFDLLDEMRLLGKGRKVVLGTGESVSDLSRELEFACGKDRMGMLRQTAIRNYSFTDEDRLFIASKLRMLERMQMEAEHRLEILRQPLFVAPQKESVLLGKAMKNTSDNLPENLSGLEALIGLANRHAHQTRELFIRYMETGEELARIQAGVAAYSGMQKRLGESRPALRNSTVDANVVLSRIIKRMDICRKKIELMRVKLLESYRNPQFFLAVSPLEAYKSARGLLTTPKDYTLAVLVWLLSCLGYAFLFVCPVLFACDTGEKDR